MSQLAAPTESAGRAPALPPALVPLLRCLECHGAVALSWCSDHPCMPELGGDGRLTCERCGEHYPVIGATVRMLPRAMRASLWDAYPTAAETLIRAGIPRPVGAARVAPDVRQRTADSFAFEWEHFGVVREQWRRNFLDYMQPHTADSFAGRLLLDVGTGSGRHALHAAQLGAHVVAVDLGRSIDVARANLPPQVLTVQADAEHLPLARAAFDFVMSIGVLHHLPDPDAALRAITTFARPDAIVHVYLYWVPEVRWHVAVLQGVTAARRVTVRLPHRLLQALCYPLAAVLAVLFVWPYRILRALPGLGRVAAALPLKTYADYPFGVLVNDQFDRLSAPLERRYERQEVRAMLGAAGLSEISVLANHGWIGDGRVQSKP